MKPIPSIILALLWGLSLGHALGQDYSNTGSIFELGTSVRAMGMGGAFTAVADDEAAVTYNPAGLVQLESPTFCSLFTRPFGAYSFGALGAADRGWGVRLLLLDSGTLVERDPYCNPTGSFRYTETGWVIAGGVRGRAGFSVGLQAKIYALALPDQGWGASLSPALFYREGPRTYGIVWRNALSTDLRFTGGSSEPWFRDLALGFAWRVGSTLVAVDFTEQLITRGDVACVRMGVESTKFLPLVIRAGTHREGSSFGLSAYWKSFRFDFAYVLHYALPGSYYAALVYHWEGSLVRTLTAPLRWLVARLE